MSGASFELTLEDMLPKRSLARLLDVVQDLTPLMDEVGMSLVTSTSRRFELGVDPDGNRWIPSRRARETGGQTLVRDRHLSDSITHDPGRAGVEWGSNLPYALIHQEGGEIVPKTGRFLVFQAGGGMVFARRVEIPARPYLGFDDDDEAATLVIVQDFMTATLEAR